MSAAFRNFVFTLVIMLGVFGYIAYKAMPDIEATVFAEESSAESEDESAPSEESKSETSEEASKPVEQIVYEEMSCLFASKNKAGDICSLVYVGVSEETQTYITCRIPVDAYTDDSGVPKQLYSLLGQNSPEYMLKKISPLIGHDIDYYILCDGNTYKALATLCEKANVPLSIELPYQIRYFDPVFEGLEIIDDYFVTIPAGKTVLTEENAAEIFNSAREEGTVSYSFQESMGLSVIRQFAGNSEFSDSIDIINGFIRSVKTNIPTAKLLDFSSLMFSYSDSRTVHITYPTANDYDRPDMKIVDWSSGIKQIKSEESK